MNKTQARVIVRAADTIERTYAMVAPTLHTMGELGEDEMHDARLTLLAAVNKFREIGMEAEAVLVPEPARAEA